MYWHWREVHCVNDWFLNWNYTSLSSVTYFWFCDCLMVADVKAFCWAQNCIYFGVLLRVMETCSFFSSSDDILFESFCEWPLMVASIFSLLMVFLECFCKEYIIRWLLFFFFRWLIILDGFVDGLLFGVVLKKVYFLGWFYRRFMTVYYLGLAQSGSCTRSHRGSTAFNIVQNIFRSGGSPLL